MQNNTIPQPPPITNEDTTPLAEPIVPIIANSTDSSAGSDDLENSPENIMEPKKYRGGGWRNVASTLAILIAAPLIALFLTAFVFQSYEVDGLSMYPTLGDHDRLIVLKTGKTWARLTHKNYVPQRGEIVVFHRKGLYSFNEDLDKQLIKRVIALPGERVVVKQGMLTVFNSQHPNGFQPDKEAAYGKDIVTTPGDGEFIVGDGQVFVSGDNRGNSFDSREFGPINGDEIVGTLALRIFPLNKFDSY
jgi:signal peptidase I